MKTPNRLMLALLSIFCLISIVNAQTTVCYKNNWDSPATIEDTALNGDVCEGKYSLNDMKKMGWSVVDIKMDSDENKLNYKYFLVNNSLDTKDIPSAKLSKKPSKSNFMIKPIGVKIGEIKDNKTVIQEGNLLVGTSGIVVHIYDNDKRLIVSNAKVIKSDKNSSTIEFFPFNDLKQDAIPTSNRVASSGDILVLNYMYQSSLLIAPTQDTFQIVRANFKYNNFLHSDVLAAKLKIKDELYPTKKTIQDFAIRQNLGTIFIVVDQNVYILDTKTFKILTSYYFIYDEDDFPLPFYSRVEDIAESILSLDTTLSILKDKKYKSYESYYKHLLGLDDD